MESLDFGVQNRIGGVTNPYISKPQNLQPIEKRPQRENKKSFDKGYCNSVQAYLAPNFIKTSQKPCSVIEYTSRLKAAGLKEGKDFVVEGKDLDFGCFALEVTLKDLYGRDKQSTTWMNGIEKSNYQGYEKYTYNPLDISYKKTETFSDAGEFLSSSEITSAIEQKEFTEFGLNFKTKPKEFIRTLQEHGRKYELAKEFVNDSQNDVKLSVKELSEDSVVLKENIWHLLNGQLVDVVQDVAGDDNKCLRRFIFNPDGSTEVVRFT